MSEHAAESDAHTEAYLIDQELRELQSFVCGAIVPERQRCICPDGLCLDHCRACNHAGRDLEEPCIADPEWEPDEYDLARREGRPIPPAAGGTHE